MDEAWTTGVLAAQGVLELLRVGQPFTKQSLERAYVARRRVSWVETEGRVAQRARDGFTRGVVSGLVGMALAGLTKGRVAMPGKSLPPAKRLPTIEEHYAGRIAPDEIARIRQDCAARGLSLHNALMERCGWPAIPHDGQLLVSHQDALLMGGKVQATPGYANHVVFPYPHLCEACGTKICIEMCSGQAITAGDKAVPAFDREKCVHCGACLWHCAVSHPDDPERSAIEFRAEPVGFIRGRTNCQSETDTR